MAQQLAQRSKKNFAAVARPRPAVVPQQNAAPRPHRIVAVLVFVGIAAGLMAYIQFNPNNPYLSELDSYYHVKMAELLQQQGVLQQFPWLQFTILRDSYVDHHLLFHVLLIPFVNLFGPILGAKLFQVLVVGLAFGLFYLVLGENGAKGAFWLSLLALFTMSSDFYFRMNFIRDMGLSLVFLMLGIYCVIQQAPPEAAEKRRRWVDILIDRRRLAALSVVSAFFAVFQLFILIPLTLAVYLASAWVESLSSGRGGAIFLVCAFYVWAYGGFMFLPIFALTYWLAQIMTGEKIDRQVPLAALAGMAAGLVFNPYFPRHLDFLFHQIFRTGLGAEAYVGGEWQPYDTWFWAQTNAVPIAIFFAGVILALIKRVEQSAKTIAIFVFSLLFLALVWKSKRFVEYSSFFMPLAGFSLLGSLLRDKAQEWRTGRFWKSAENVLYAVAAPAVLGIATFFAFGPFNLDNFFAGQIPRARHDTQTLFSMSALKKVHGYLLQHAAPGDIVFTDDWDVFPRYFFANTKTYYIVGLDPEFMNQYAGEPYPGRPGQLYLEFAQISSGSDPNHLERIKNDFKAKWVVVNVSHLEFYQNLKRQPALFEEVLFAANDSDVDRYPAAVEDGYYLFKVL